jgi:hypothetical protein
MHTNNQHVSQLFGLQREQGELLSRLIACMRALTHLSERIGMAEMKHLKAW